MNEQNKRKIEEVKKLVKEILDIDKNKFIPGTTPVTTGLGFIDYYEVNAVIESLLKGWLGLDKNGREFEQLFSQYVNVKHSVFVNSGSSANLLLLDSIKKLCSLEEGEIITPALTFPTTVNPVIQLGFTPVLTDVDSTLNISLKSVETANNKKTVGIIVPHILGNPAPIDEIAAFAEKNKLFIIEDCCQALGSKYGKKMCGSFGTASTFSFYPSHKITTGEGGMISTDNEELYKIILSGRDWGRMNPVKDKKERFSVKLGTTYYDSKYIYSNIGYNFKPLELQAVIGLEQLIKIEQFNKKRKENYNYYKEKFKIFADFFKLPDSHDKAEPCFFGFPVIIKNREINRRELLVYLAEHKIDTRLFFAGNITKQPAYKNTDFKVSGKLENTDMVAENGFWLGIHPGITEEMIDYVTEIFQEFLTKVQRG